MPEEFWIAINFCTKMLKFLACRLLANSRRSGMEGLHIPHLHHPEFSTSHSDSDHRTCGTWVGPVMAITARKLRNVDLYATISGRIWSSKITDL